MKINIIIDKLTLILEIAPESLSLVSEILFGLPLRWKYQEEGFNKFFKAAINNKALSVDDSFLNIEAWHSEGIQKIRLSFNPTKVCPYHLTIISKFLLLSCKIQCSRVDIAFDISKNLSNHIINEKPTKKITKFFCRRNFLETTCIGSNNSEKRIICYDKGRQIDRRIKSPSNYWRIEYQLKKRKVKEFLLSPEKLLSNLVLVGKYDTDSFKEIDRWKLLALSENASFFYYLENDYQRTKYHKLLQEYESESILPCLKKAWEDSQNRVIKELSAWINGDIAFIESNYQ